MKLSERSSTGKTQRTNKIDDNPPTLKLRFSSDDRMMKILPDQQSFFRIEQKFTNCKKRLFFSDQR
ncbi:hypothetical protein LEP1GSC038_0447 [Leptospira weilii str. 2006001855]|uniref:Uncharacterized protein n=2 Tax=Leptospira weilii TaxID=28184 RepID=M6QRW2_9LEPT|nr:hypothetical protein LEP1GSC038_0447 [Leptospira weilii str. 2006001855]EMN91552.1 hypothetical protein LEP1GSC108_4038 [Leptospira weilii str. UI 13098]OMI16618.1 hypothetical protein BUQ74_14495 [Leptospira weilii serovar Heyan]